MNKLAFGISIVTTMTALFPAQAGKPISLNIGKGAVMQFIECPAGEFMMGRPGRKKNDELNFHHKVSISRPFWLAKYKVSHGVWNAYKKVVLTEEDKVLGGMKRVHYARWDEVEAFCEWLTKKHRKNLPPGYVVRIPTDAEWEYAYCYRIGAEKPDDPYVRIMEAGWPKDEQAGAQAWKEFAGIAINSEIYPKLEKAKLPLPAYRWQMRGAAVGMKTPNVLGFYDMVGNGGERVLDNAPKSKWGEGGNRMAGQTAIVYEKSETDPLRSSLEDANPVFMSRGSRIPAGLHIQCMAGQVAPFRLCIGPDLITEKGLKKQ